MSLHSQPLSRFWTTKFLFLLIKAAQWRSSKLLFCSPLFDWGSNPRAATRLGVQPKSCYIRGEHYCYGPDTEELCTYMYIKITSLTCSPLLTCCSVGDLKKPHYRSYASDPMSWIFNKCPSSTNRIARTCSKQSCVSLNLNTFVVS